MEYADEPRLVFSPLPEKEYCRLYAIEMDSFVDDAPFYSARLNPDDVVLELGCGSGRLGRLLSSSCRKIKGLDLSAEMIRLATSQPLENVTYLQADMTDFALDERFDVIIVPYNSLNLLAEPASIERCLRVCRKHLQTGGRLLLQLYHPDKRLRETKGAKLFQFAIFDLLNSDKVIKETLKEYDPTAKTVLLEERYRLRPHGPGKSRQDLHHFLTLYAPDFETWSQHLASAGFSAAASGDFDGRPFADDDTTLLIEARCL